jgi:hypothetical protein
MVLVWKRFGVVSLIVFGTTSEYFAVLASKASSHDLELHLDQTRVNHPSFDGFIPHMVKLGMMNYCLTHMILSEFQESSSLLGCLMERCWSVSCCLDVLLCTDILLLHRALCKFRYEISALPSCLVISKLPTVLVGEDQAQEPISLISMKQQMFTLSNDQSLNLHFFVHHHQSSSATLIPKLEPLRFQSRHGLVKAARLTARAILDVLQFRSLRVDAWNSTLTKRASRHAQTWVPKCRSFQIIVSSDWNNPRIPSWCFACAVAGTGRAPPSTMPRRSLWVCNKCPTPTPSREGLDGDWKTMKSTQNWILHGFMVVYSSSTNHDVATISKRVDQLNSSGTMN